MSEVRRAAEAARDAAQHVATLTTEHKNAYLRELARALVADEDDILAANASDLARAEEDGLSTPKLQPTPYDAKTPSSSLCSLTSFLLLLERKHSIIGKAGCRFWNSISRHIVKWEVVTFPHSHR